MKIQGNAINITQNRYEVVNDIKKINISIKARQKREMERVVVLQWLLEDS